ncbi:hypothetical protein M5X06_20930 [Paenibacillus alvei]|uniref:hypothetical protein n=1 Tax=Paenibacillus alvei TaxID=44250 RepID=UPI002280713E|nr:hypothetical protein [Paenibacillus alvei]MCY9769257.1 hypothetical protein [Paenibacillus alvei]
MRVKTLWKWLRRGLLTVIILFILLAGAAYFYIQPSTAIGWPPQVEVSLADRLEQMVHNRSLTIQISEEEINGWGSQHMQETEPYRSLKEKWNITGMKTRLANREMEATIQMEPISHVQAEVKIKYELEWSDSGQSIRAVPVDACVKNISLPLSWFSLKPMEFSLSSQLPEWVKVKEVKFLEDGWKLRFGLKL